MYAMFLDLELICGVPDLQGADSYISNTTFSAYSIIPFSVFCLHSDIVVYL
jgi:hypothetical protein